MNDSNDFQPIEQHVIGRDQHNGQNAQRHTPIRHKQ